MGPIVNNTKEEKVLRRDEKRRAVIVSGIRCALEHDRTRDS